MFHYWKLKFFIATLLFDLFFYVDMIRYHPYRLVRKNIADTSLKYILAKMGHAVPFPTTRQLLKFALNSVSTEGCYLEFGVFKGGSIRYISKQITPNIIHGFDSFEGLPEVWQGAVSIADNFNARGKLPKVPKNVILHKGWFSETLPIFLKKNDQKVAFIHIDCDLYSSTKEVLSLLHDIIVPGTIISFDEYFNVPNWEQNEFKAFQEYVIEHGVTYEYIAYSALQVTIKILTINN
ncbi:MAG: class I SAM-dependent methyltransferase [Candidatus Electrothrix sp. LOE1_4_5]|nr:class I SAM-dependent methyltransferase [Candidatus Electrothrix gigas]